MGERILSRKIRYGFGSADLFLIIHHFLQPLLNLYRQVYRVLDGKYPAIKNLFHYAIFLMQIFINGYFLAPTNNARHRTIE